MVFHLFRHQDQTDSTTFILSDPPNCADKHVHHSVGTVSAEDPSTKAKKSRSQDVFYST